MQKKKVLNHQRKRLMIAASGAGMGVLGAMALSIGVISAEAHADSSTSSTSTAAVTVNTSCQMSATIDIPHTATMAGGVYRSDIGKTTIKAMCNDANGYALYAIGYTNTESGRNDMLGGNTGRTIATGTATSGDASNWAMKLTAVAGTYQPTIESDASGSFASYHAIPSDYTKVASLSGSTDDGAVGSKVETTYATYVTGGQASDTYSGKVKYMLVHPSTTPDTPCTAEYTITYNGNTGSGNMEAQTACVDRQVALLPNGFTAPAPASEHQFAFWNTKADGSGYSYSPGQSVANLAAAGESVTLYAIWGPKYIQDLTAATCNLLANDTINMSYKVYDRRDGSDYTVRYIEGACWMTQNLRLTGTVNREHSNFDRVENFDVCEGDLTAGDSYDQARCHDSGDTNTGVWYNYAAATAGQITGSSNTTEATQDICPAGWRMPSYNSAGGAGTINSITSSATLFTPVTGGRYEGGSLKNLDNGNWWSTIAGGYIVDYFSYMRYTMHYRGSGSRTYGYNRGYGCYIRCTRTL